MPPAKKTEIKPNKKNSKLGIVYNEETGLVFKSQKEKIVIGRFEDKAFVPLDEKTIELCEEYGQEYDKSLVKEEAEEQEEEKDTDEQEAGEEEKEKEAEEQEEKEQETEEQEEEKPEEKEEQEKEEPKEVPKSNKNKSKSKEVKEEKTEKKPAKEADLSSLVKTTLTNLQEVTSQLEEFYLQKIKELEDKLKKETEAHLQLKTKLKNMLG